MVRTVDRAQTALVPGDHSAGIDGPSTVPGQPEEPVSGADVDELRAGPVGGHGVHNGEEI